mmetsp:Transcript_3949/g.12960  ORF Transcript_3949/g.12960 Transcript_3949/m.12960 type:complete len:253 (-) Transcript_3949:89-847(-)
MSEMSRKHFALRSGYVLPPLAFGMLALLAGAAPALALPTRVGVRLHPTPPPRVFATMSEMSGKFDELEAMKRQLAEAVENERYREAAELRDALESLASDEEVAILAANDEFYTAFSGKSVTAMEAVWAGCDEDSCPVMEEVFCSHPGYAFVTGRHNVLESFGDIFQTTPPMRVRCLVDSVRLLRGGLSAVVTCREIVGGADEKPTAGGGAAGPELVAINIFEKGEDGAWKLVMRQAGPCAPQARPCADNISV